ncbi:nitroreductase/quinone reductase family protein, partial [Mycobacterium tuberculosis]|uniref:nitroreductase/quinone reductase family protein n=1 Tax=Mycobacterium tuberculosis TaxID=1773 RepID=UPI001BAB90B7
HPEVRVQIRAQRLELIARDATDAERERYWPPLMRMYPPYRKYREAADRVVPLVVGEPARRAGADGAAAAQSSPCVR